MEGLYHALQIGFFLGLSMVFWGGGMFLIKYIANGEAPEKLNENETKIVCALMVVSLVLVMFMI